MIRILSSYGTLWDVALSTYFPVMAFFNPIAVFKHSATMPYKKTDLPSSNRFDLIEIVLIVLKLIVTLRGLLGTCFFVFFSFRCNEINPLHLAFVHWTERMRLNCKHTDQLRTTWPKAQPHSSRLLQYIINHKWYWFKQNTYAPNSLHVRQKVHAYWDLQEAFAIKWFRCNAEAEYCAITSTTSALVRVGSLLTEICPLKIRLQRVTSPIPKKFGTGLPGFKRKPWDLQM